MNTFNNGESPYNNNNMIKWDLKFSVKPKPTFRMRTEDKHSHGCFKGEHSIEARDNCFPEVELTIENNSCNNLGTFYIVADLFTPCSSLGNLILSPFYFGRILEKDEKSKHDKNYEVTIDQVFKEFQYVKDKKFAFPLIKYFPIKPKKDEIDKILEEKSKTRATLYNVQTSTEHNFDAVCLGFSVHHLQSDGSLKCVHEPILSQPILNVMSNKLKIVRVCNPRGSIRGHSKDTKAEISLFVSEIIKKQKQFIHVLIDDQQGWTFEIESSKLEWHSTKGITFELPPYRGRCEIIPGQDINCKISLIAKYADEDVSSEKWDFVYENPISEYYQESSKNQNRKRTIEDDEKLKMEELPTTSNVKKCRIFKDSLPISNSISTHTEIIPNIDQKNREDQKLSSEIKKLRELMKKNVSRTETETEIEEVFNKQFLYIDYHGVGNTIFHDAIIAGDDDFLLLYELIRDYNLSSSVRAARNDFGESVLHVACRFGRHQFLRYFVSIKCNLWLQNKHQQTPLHVAIENGDVETLNCWRDLLENPPKYLKENFYAQFKRTLNVYDNRGFTVLHSAIIKDQRELVCGILQFCNIENIALDQHRILGSGDTLLHLAASRELRDIARIIIDNVPSALDFENYSCEAVSDCENIIEKLSLESEE